ncbi:MAG: Asp-tRNA(Asn)/Glu-tRNA(Gln) amidotransferase subunit GatB [Candidatus Zixiibacteriota bacterium]
MAVYEGYEPVIGLEVHAQLQTESKIFCGCKVAFGAEPNSLTCPVCLGLPGALPVLNRKAVEYAMKLVLAVGGRIRSRSVFARKNYFYPDLPKGYQISQYSLPVGEGGVIRFTLDNGRKKICRLNRIHLEEDAGKLLHPEQGELYSRVDYNRCGTPLAEIVTEPDLRSPAEAYAYLIKLKQILQYTGVCSGDMEKGHLRCDANISMRLKGARKLGVRTELKNLNSFKAVERALDYEIERQVKQLSGGKEIKPVTLSWNESRQKVESMRSKEESDDYRYFPEPDLPVLHINESWIESVGEYRVELPNEKTERFVKQYDIRPYDARILTETIELADYFERVMAVFANGRIAANWIITEILSIIVDIREGITNLKITPEKLADLLKRIAANEITARSGKQILKEMLTAGENAASIIEKKGLVQLDNEKTLLPLVENVLNSNLEKVEAYRNGKTALWDYFVGQVMQATRGRANPKRVKKLLKKILEG